MACRPRHSHIPAFCFFPPAVVHAKLSRPIQDHVDKKYQDIVRQRFRGLKRGEKRKGSNSEHSKSAKAPTRPVPSPVPPPPPPGIHSDCNFVFKYNDVKFFQVEDGGTILNYNQVPSDTDLITICQGNKCVGEPQEVIGIATGACIAGQDRLVFTLATDENPTLLDFQVFCPDVTWLGGGECLAIDIDTAQPVLPFPNVTVSGPSMIINDIQFSSLVQCELACIPRPEPAM